MDSGWKTNVEISPSCPRCGSSNTKFCYYNNYSLTQPRYFCKGCRRYWTKGGSLRNVPVGGGCRKNRRGKSLKLSSTDVAHSRNLGYGVTVSNREASSVESCSSSMTSDGSHIDLALVYANFLNPRPDSKTTTTTTTANTADFEVQELHTSDFSSFPNTNLESTSVQLHGENHNSTTLGGCLTTFCDSSTETPLTENDHHLMYFHQAEENKVQQCTSTLHESIHYGLPPLPGEEVGPHHEILWSNSHLMGNDHTLQVTQDPPILGPETQDPNNLLFGNWNPFDLSSDHDTFSGP
ncbi:hypothetical protein MANES_08G034200v8 [Manihot esculenta]|uniref:Dof zinc finger protein n=2 Tax=Manihot esculenta TaxID=3983 RepID=A0A2C9VD94_MANES|nr:hypothetical protein MANES_08G034200v8 [Manihot esculenta]